MSFRKFGTSDDQRVSVDGEDNQGVQKSAAKAIWTERDSADLLRESTDQSDNSVHVDPQILS